MSLALGRIMWRMKTSGWFGVRCVFKVDDDAPAASYEERVTVWRAADAGEAVRLAEAEAVEYASTVEAQYLGFAQAYTMADELSAGAEVFSLIRTSSLGRADYLTAFFDTGNEAQERAT
jgi:hypothetical protein